MQRYALKNVWRNGAHSFKLGKDKNGNFVSFRTATKKIRDLEEENKKLKEKLNSLFEDIAEKSKKGGKIGKKN